MSVMFTQDSLPRGQVKKREAKGQEWEDQRLIIFRSSRYPWARPLLFTAAVCRVLCGPEWESMCRGILGSDQLQLLTTNTIHSNVFGRGNPGKDKTPTQYTAYRRTYSIWNSWLHTNRISALLNQIKLAIGPNDCGIIDFRNLRQCIPYKWILGFKCFNTEIHIYSLLQFSWFV